MTTPDEQIHLCKSLFLKEIKPHLGKDLQAMLIITGQSNQHFVTYSGSGERGPMSNAFTRILDEWRVDEDKKENGFKTPT